MRILLSNDDGFDAPGLRELHKYLEKDHEVLRIGPAEERSTTGHTLSLDRPLRLFKHGENVFSCSGYPADCVFMGLGHVWKDTPPDLVVSGINRGANLGQDVYYSGTVAAAREAAFRKLPAIAVSLVLDRPGEDHHYFDTAAKVICDLINVGIHKGQSPMSVLNVNVPNLPYGELKGIRSAELGMRCYSDEVDARVDSRGRNYYWVAGVYQGHEGGASCDTSIVESGQVAVTPLHSHPGNEGSSWPDNALGQLDLGRSSR